MGEQKNMSIIHTEKVTGFKNMKICLIALITKEMEIKLSYIAISCP